MHAAIRLITLILLASICTGIPEFEQQYSTHKFTFYGIHISNAFPQLPFHDPKLQMLPCADKVLILTRTNLFSLSHYPSLNVTKINIAVLPGSRMSWLEKEKTLIVAGPRGVQICMIPFNKPCIHHDIELGVNITGETMIVLLLMIIAVTSTSSGTIYIGSDAGLISLNKQNGKVLINNPINESVTALAWNEKLSLLAIGTMQKLYFFDQITHDLR
jgi:hypothetical protein